jgi:pimeloyl-ACP methyl ester carboxylesterase
MGDQHDLHVTEWGKGDRVVLVHGGTPGGGSMAFDAQRELEEDWHLVLPDRPGHGQSPRQGREDFERDANLLGPLLSVRSHLVGHSYGGVVALCMAQRSPEAVRSLTLIEPPAFCFAMGDPAVAAMAKANRELFEHPPENPVDMMRTFFSLVGIDMQIPDPAPEPFLPIAEAFARDLGDIRGPDEARIDVDALKAGGFPVQILTSGRIRGFEGIADAIAEQTGGHHIVVSGTDHTVQNAGDRVNPLLERFWSAAQEGEKEIEPGKNSQNEKEGA